MLALLAFALGCSAAPCKPDRLRRMASADPVVGEYEAWSFLELGPSWRDTVTLEPTGRGRMNNAAVLFALGEPADIAIRWHRSGDVVVIEPRSPERRARLDGVWLARLDRHILKVTRDPVARDGVRAWAGSGDLARKLWADQLWFKAKGSGSGKWTY